MQRLSEDRGMPVPINARVGKRRAALRAAGLRPLQIWVPDVRQPGFADACRRQAQAVAQADASDHGLSAILDSALDDLDDEDAP
jgi:hypothetical protein